MNKAEELSFKDINIGLRKEFSLTLTEELVKDFARISGDYNPLHMDAAYAKTTKFKKKIVPGMLLSSFFSRLVGMHIPGKKALYLLQNLRFKNPAYMGDNVRIVGKVTAVSEKLKLITLETIILNQDNQVLVEGEAKVSYLED